MARWLSDFLAQFASPPMTEARWLTETDPLPLLKFFGPRLSERSLRLFACGCVQLLLWDWLDDPRSRQAVQVSERFADGLASSAELGAAYEAALAACERSPGKKPLAVVFGAPIIPTGPARYAAIAAAETADPEVRLAVTAALGMVARAGEEVSTWDLPAAARLWAARATLLRDVAGNPFHPVTVDPAWLRWQGGTVVRLARTMYEEDHLEELPVLADALEDAGCTDATILSHLRHPGPHIRGCWCLDRLRSGD